MVAQAFQFQQRSLSSGGCVEVERHVEPTDQEGRKGGKGRGGGVRTAADGAAADR